MSKVLRDDLIEYMSKASYAPENKSELARSLRIPSKQRAEFRDIVDELEDAGEIVRLRKGAYALKKSAVNSLVEGKIKCLRSGKVLFIPDDPQEASARLGAGLPPVTEVVVPPNKRMSVMDRDRVAVRLELLMPKGWLKRNKGRPSLDDMRIGVRIEQITKRFQARWVGVYQPGRGFGRVLGDGDSSPELVEVAERPSVQPEAGQVVVVEPIAWGEGRMPARGKIVENLGWYDSAGVDMEVIIRKYGLHVQFSQDVLDHVAGLADDMDSEELSRREDWTDRGIMSIDPEGARDFDDAIYVEKTENGWQLAVHIADVSHYVRTGTPLDNEAQARGNSTYLPDRVLPMLPPRLSDDLCSLKAGEIRLTKVCVMDFNGKGSRIHARFANAYIRNEQQMTYPRAFAKMTGKGEDPASMMLREAWALASLLRKRRMENGALDLDFPEVRVLVNEKGEPTKVVSEEYDESHQLIEEFMLAANEAVAEALKNAGQPTIYRIHEDPDLAKLKEFGETCKLYGHPVHDLQNRKNLSKLLASIKNSPDEQMLKLALLRSLMRARYDTQPLGHFGLAKTNYCHFTSPIRRYADLEVHRALDAWLKLSPVSDKRHLSVGVLQEIADHISETERLSADAERDAHRLKLFEWLFNQSHEAHPEVHEALVTEPRHFGVLVEIPRLQIKGLIKASDLSRSGWYYEGFAERWSNRGEKMAAGDKVNVVPSYVDRERQWVDFSLIAVLSSRFQK